MKTQHLKEVSAEAEMDVPTLESRMQAFVFPPLAVDAAQCPTV